MWEGERNPLIRWAQILLCILLIPVISGIVGLWLQEPLFAAALCLLPARWAGWSMGRLAAWPVGLIVLAAFLVVLVLRPTEQTIAEHARFATAGVIVAALAWFTARERRTGDLAARHAGVDSLTGILNRNALLKRLGEEANRASRSGLPLSIAYLDCDSFKPFNDEKGHLAGDAVLIEAAETMARLIRNYDSVARMGGDEFAILFPGLTAKDAQTAAARVQNALSRLGQPPGQLTWTVGVACYESPAKPEEMLDRADRLMLEQKTLQRGSMKVETFSRVPPPASSLDADV